MLIHYAYFCSDKKADKLKKNMKSPPAGTTSSKATTTNSDERANDAL
jgi:hypothetical protein